MNTPQTQNLPGMWLGRDGRFTPETLVKEYEKKREAVIVPLIEKWTSLHAEMASLKAQMFDEVEALLEFCFEDYGVELSGKKGNVTLYKYDGSYLIQRKFQARIQFDERIFAAEELVRECLEDWSGDARAELQTLILAAFERNKEGDIRRSELIRLRNLAIEDERWQQAMKIIAEAEQIIDSACYFQVQQRDPKTGKYNALLLDFSAIRPKRKAKVENMENKESA